MPFFVFAHADWSPLAKFDWEILPRQAYAKPGGGGFLRSLTLGGHLGAIDNCWVEVSASSANHSLARKPISRLGR
jgi:hypothetical protein